MLGVNRFFLSALSAALPHVVADDKLVMANSVAPTSGTIVAFVGGPRRPGRALATGGGPGGSAVDACWRPGPATCSPGWRALRMPRDLLGPDREPGDSRLAGLAHELRLVLAGWPPGCGTSAGAGAAAAALVATGSHRFLYGILLLMSILLYRNYFYPGSDGNDGAQPLLPAGDRPPRSATARPRW